MFQFEILLKIPWLSDAHAARSQHVFPITKQDYWNSMLCSTIRRLFQTFPPSWTVVSL